MTSSDQHPSKNSFVGKNKEKFAMMNKQFSVMSNGTPEVHFHFLSNFTFFTIPSFILAGAISERCKLSGYILFTVFSSIVIYPFVLHWTWGGGFLRQIGRGHWDDQTNTYSGDFANAGYTDVAGSGVVFLSGGVSALVGCFMVGPRRFIGERESDANGAKNVKNLIYITVGSLILWFAWYGLGGIGVMMNDDSKGATKHEIPSTEKIARSLITTTFAAIFASASCGVLSYCFQSHDFSRKLHDNDVTLAELTAQELERKKRKVSDNFNSDSDSPDSEESNEERGKTTNQKVGQKQKKIDLFSLTTGLLGGLVAISASCCNVDIWASIVIGLVAGFLVFLGGVFLAHSNFTNQYDDPSGSVFPVYVLNGFWGLISVGLFHQEKGIVYGKNHIRECLGPNLVGIVCI